MALFTLAPDGTFLPGEEQNLAPLKLDAIEPGDQTAVQFFSASSKMVQALESVGRSGSAPQV